MERKPIYHKKANLRIVSRPNGLWAVQTNSKPEGFRSKTHDKWEDLMGAGKLSLGEAKRRMEAEASRFGG